MTEVEWLSPTKVKKKNKYRFSSGKIDKVKLANDILNVIREKPLCYRDIYEFIHMNKSGINSIIRLMSKIGLVENHYGRNRFVLWKASKTATPENVKRLLSYDDEIDHKPFNPTEFAGMLNSLASPASFLSQGSPCQHQKSRGKKASTVSSTRTCISYEPDGSRTKTTQKERLTL